MTDVAEVGKVIYHKKQGFSVNHTVSTDKLP